MIECRSGPIASACAAIAARPAGDRIAPKVRLPPAAATSGVQAYFSGLPFVNGAQQANLSAVVANAALGYFSALTVLLYVSGSGTAVPVVSGTGFPWRVILSSLTVNIGSS